ncbi:Mercuric reductase [Anoxybacillus thermarum]|uniref:Mercuric reductase n=1 Tax=Anoxybacillus thermarum TaxID=404937 RepID=A0A0D0QXY7_9BACL|nr:Mercuric reductase [Anoxybacillus thermarum]
MGNVYFFTGFPGFISSMLLEELIAKWTPEKIYTLVLPSMKEKAMEEKERICSSTHFPQAKWEIVEGDITKSNLSLLEKQLHMLAQSVTHVFHLAAIYDLAVPEDIARIVNVEGTKQVNEWVSLLPHLQRYVYFSTAYVSGTRQGVIFEHELDKGQSFKNHYEETKFLAEVAVREVAHNVPTTIIRPGIVVGHSKTGETMKFDGLYFMLNGKKQMVEAEELLIAAGRTPNTAALRLEAAGVKTSPRGEIIVNDYLQTTNPSIYAAGDVTLGPQFVYVAAYEGTIAAANAIGGQHKKIQLDTIPAVTFSSPAVATVGLTEQQAKENGYEIKTSVLPLEAVPRAIVNYETTGVFKLVADAKTGKLLGAHVVAEHAGEVIYAATLAVKFGLTIDDLRETLAPYLTMSEGLKLAALTFDQDVGKLSCCAG